MLTEVYSVEAAGGFLSSDRLLFMPLPKNSWVSWECADTFRSGFFKAWEDKNNRTGWKTPGKQAFLLFFRSGVSAANRENSRLRILTAAVEI